MRKDIEHLNLLAIFNYVMAGLALLPSLGGFFYVFIGVIFLNMPPPRPNGPPPPPREAGWVIIAFGACVALAFITLAVFSLVAGICLHRRKWRIFCFVNAALQLTFMPIGTVLGIFTILVLARPTVEALFSGKVAPTNPEERGRRDPDEDDYRPPPPPRKQTEDEGPRERAADGAYYDPRDEVP